MAIPTKRLTAEGGRLLARLREIAAVIAADEARENATLDAQKASCLSQGKDFTDPRTGVTTFPRRA